MMLTTKDHQELLRAMRLLEKSGYTAKITDVLGSSFDGAVHRLPDHQKIMIDRVVQTALHRATKIALLTMREQPHRPSSTRLHKLGVACTGALGGAMGMGALAVELPISTTIMLRSIADIARSEGEILGSADCQVACLEVLALQGGGDLNDRFESKYYAARIVLARATQEMSEKLLGGGAIDLGAPLFLRFISLVAERFGLQITEKVIAQAVPAVGALGGAAINTFFLEQYQRLARGHFIIRRLERKYGVKRIQMIYGDICQERREARVIGLVS